MKEMNLNIVTCALNGGEDYELLFTCSLDDYEKLIPVEDLYIIGHITKPEYGCNLIGRNGEGKPGLRILCTFVEDDPIGGGIVISTKMNITIAIYVFILIYSMRYSYFLNGLGKLRLQLICTVTAALLFIPSAYIVVEYTDDIICLIAVMCFINLPGLIINRIQFGKLMNRKARGIWNQ